MNVVYPGHQAVEQVSGALARALDAICARVNTVFKKQHTVDGAHTDITGESLSVTGEITAEGEDESGVGGDFVAGGVLRSEDAQLELEYERTDIRNYKQIVFRGSSAFLGVYDLTVVEDSESNVAIFEYNADTITVGTIDGTHTGTWSGSKIGLAKGGTNADLSATGGTSQFLKQASAGAAITVARPAATDLSDWTAWTAVSFAAGNFTGSGSMTWTVASGDQRRFAYTKLGTRLTVAFHIITSTVGGTPAVNLQITIPGSFTSAAYGGTTIWYDDNGTKAIGRALVEPSDTKIYLQKTDGSNWTASTDATEIVGTITFETTA